VIVCGRRWGKTTLAINQLVFESLANKQGGDYWYVAPTYRQAKAIAWRLLVEIWRQLPEGLAKDKNESELWVEIGNSRITLKGADNEDSLRGSGLWGIILDEVASYRNWEYLWQEVLRPALSDHKGFAWFISTPQGFNHFYKLYLAQEKDQDFISFHFTTYDNPHMSESEINKARIQLTDDSFAQEYLADFRKHSGLVYKEFDRKVHVIDPIDIPVNWQVYRTMDFGAVNPTVCLWVALDNSDNIYVFDEYYKTGETSKFHTEVIKAKTRHDVVVTWGDPSAEQESIDYGSFGLTITPAVRIFGKDHGWVSSGIEKVRETLKLNSVGRPRLYIFRNCEKTIEEFEKYRWMEKKEDLNARDVPEKVDDHCMDALRYFICSHAPDPNRYDEPVYVKTNSFTGY
jgi:PBSX family phage terminase large subunit